MARFIFSRTKSRSRLFAHWCAQALACIYICAPVASIAERFLYHRKSGGISYDIKKTAALMAGLSLTLSLFSTNASASSYVHHHATGSTTRDTSTGTYSGNIIAPFTSDLDVRARVSGGPEICYDLDISWGTMMFEYDYGASWNPTTHSYQYTLGRVNSQMGGWVTDTHVDSVHNKITVNNNSNFPMKADFSYNNAASGALNSDPDATGSVIGIFSSSEGAFELDESLLMEGVNGARAPRMRTGSLTLEMISTNLQDGDSYYYAVSDDSALATQYMYFALSGIPDQGGPRTYQPVGAITINISPATLVTKKTK